MAAELFGGAALGAAMGELLNAVLTAKRKTTDFIPSLEILEFTLKNINPRLEKIGHLKKKDPKSDDLEVIFAIVNKGEKLVKECYSISSMKVPNIKIIQHSNALQSLNGELIRYFTNLLPLDHYINDLEVKNMVTELHKKFIVGNDEGSSSQGESESFDEKPKKNEEETVKEEAKESYPENENAEKVYEKRSGKKLFLLKGCTYDFDVEDLENPDHHGVLGKGSYGTSYKCITKYGAVVVKMLNTEVKVREREFEERMEEIVKIGSHPNIMVPFGYFYSDFNKFLLYEYKPKGSFKALLNERKLFQGVRMYWNRRLKIAIGVARGISHIHSQGGLIHGNIKSSNVLLTEDLNGCISDFGLAPKMNFPPTKSEKQRFLHPGNDAPELKKTMEATQKSDVYYFGLMLLQTVPEKENRLWWHPKVAGEMFNVIQLGNNCAGKDPNTRPKMNEVVRKLQNIRPDL